jgi:hypothetical protein
MYSSALAHMAREKIPTYACEYNSRRNTYRHNNCIGVCLKRDHAGRNQRTPCKDQARYQDHPKLAEASSAPPEDIRKSQKQSPDIRYIVDDRYII